MFIHAFSIRVVAAMMSFSTMSLMCHAKLLNQRKAEGMNVQIKEPWSEVKCSVILRGEKTVTVVSGRKAVCETELKPNRNQSTVVTSFVAPTSGNPWLGPEQDFYLETDNRIVGIRLSSQVILWCDSLARDSRPKPGVVATIDDVTADFGKNVDGPQLLKAEWAIDPDPDTKQVRRTHLKEVINNPFFFTSAPLSSEQGKPEITDIGIDEGLLKVDMTSQTSEYKATVWIDIDKKKATKANFDEFKMPLPKSLLQSGQMPSTKR